MEHKNFLNEIFEELDALVPATDHTHELESKVNHLLVGLINAKSKIQNSFTLEESEDLIKRIHNAIKTNDPMKFSRGIRKIQESRRGRRKTV